MSEISEKQICSLILESMRQIKESDAVYKNWVLNEDTVVLGGQSPMDSVAFTAFVISLEEKLEDALKRSYELNLEKIYGGDDPEKLNLSASHLASRIHSKLS